MPEIVCAKCGRPAESALYQNVEVQGVGWSNVEVEAHDDGSVSATTDNRVQEIEYSGFKTPLEFGCSNCGAESMKIEDLVKLKHQDGEVDPQDLTPIPGQMSIEEALVSSDADFTA